MSDAESRARGRTRGERPLWSCKTLWVAIALTLVGAAAWGYALVAASGGPAEEPGTRATGVTGLAPQEPGEDGQGGATPGSGQRVAASAPVLFRFGGSFVAGFFLGYLARRFVLVTVLLAGAAATAIFVLERTGVLGIDWAGVREQTNAATAWVSAQFGSFRTLVTGYLPSGAAAAVGGFMGSRRR